MGMLRDGKWEPGESGQASPDGQFHRAESGIRNWVTPDGSPGPEGERGFQAQPDRYHLYVSYACPWANRALILRKLKGLEAIVSLSAVHWYMGEDGWTFNGDSGVAPDPIHGADYLHEVYTAAEPGYTGRVTVPVLFDRHSGRIVSNESADIIRMFNSAFDGIGATDGDYYPKSLRNEIDEINARIYETVNNGVYKAGFASTQKAYEKAVGDLFESLDWLDKRLASRRYLVGNQLTEADWRLFTTLVRFDAVYHGHFKCNIHRLIDYSRLWPYTQRLYQYAGVAETVRLDHIKSHYYKSHKHINPTGVVPVGPSLDFEGPVIRR